jgi:hypothetical protein
MKGMSWRVASPKGSSNSKPLYWIVVSIGLVAVFITFASWFFVSYPIGSTVHGYIYGVESSQISGLSVSQKINITSVDLHMNVSLYLVDNKAPSKIEKNDTSLDSHVLFSESASPKIVPVTKEVNGLETSDAVASKSSIPVTGTNSSIMKGNIRFEETTFVVSMIISKIMNRGGVNSSTGLSK